MHRGISLKEIIHILKDLAKDKTVLIVEDDTEILKSLARMLSKLFMSVYTATNVMRALEIYQKISHNVNTIVITDINLGSTSGIDLTYALKELNAEQKVIGISGTQDREVFVDAIRCGIDSFILKPLDTNEFYKALIRISQKIEYDLELKKSHQLLEDSREYAHKLLAEQDQFLKNAIHEIHTPLAVIITNIDLLRLQNIENESLNSIEAASRIIQNSYEDMTYLMKKNRIPDTSININIIKFIKDRINYFTCIAEVNDLSFATRVGQLNLPEIHFSELKLSRMVDNTLSNAIKYSYRPSDIQVTIGLQINYACVESRHANDRWRKSDGPIKNT